MITSDSFWAILKFVCPKEKVLSERKMTLTLFLDFKKVFAVIVFIKIVLMAGKTSAQPMGTSIITVRTRT